MPERGNPDPLWFGDYELYQPKRRLKMEQKWFLQSKRFWGMFITTATAVMPALGPWLGWDIKPALIVDLGEAGNQLISAVGGFVGVFVMFVGSMKAKGPMTIAKPE